MKKFVALLTKENERTTMNEWENDDSDILWTLYRGYKKLRQLFFHTYLLTCLNKDTSVLLSIKKYKYKLSIKTMVLTLKNTMHMHTIPLIKS